METTADGGGRARSKPQKLTMEEYLFFVETNKLVDLPVDQLNQIIGFHGYKKLHKTHKKVMCEAVSTMELMKPSRSTLEDDGVSSCAMISLDDVIQDLNDLSWQECCVTSLQMLNSVDIQPHHNHLNSIASDPSGSTAKMRRPRNKLRKLMIDNASSNNNSNASGGIGGDHVEAASYGSIASDPSGSTAKKTRRPRNKLRKLMMDNANSNTYSNANGGISGDHVDGLGSGDSRSASCSSVIHREGGGGRATKLSPKRKRSFIHGDAGGSAVIEFGSR